MLTHQMESSATCLEDGEKKKSADPESLMNYPLVMLLLYRDTLPKIFFKKLKKADNAQLGTLL